jgi:phytoene/squalene synthetase
LTAIDRPPTATASSETGDALADSRFCDGQLIKVSRTFALSIRLLPKGLERPVLISYLVCRLADTVEDSARLSPPRKRALLARLAASLEDGTAEWPVRSAAIVDDSAPEAALIRGSDRVLREYWRLPDAIRGAVSPWIQEMCRGMAEFADGCEGTSGVKAIETVGDLKRYCYYVAGTVGCLLTELFTAHWGDRDPEHVASLRRLGIGFGLGLQMTNIVKDIHDDRRRDIIYVPRDLCLEQGIAPEQLLDPDRREPARRVMGSMVEMARRHLEDGIRYCLSLPRSQYRVRLFCLSALYFAARTLRLAGRRRELLEPNYRLKISRREVYRTLAAAALVAPSNWLVERYYRRLQPFPLHS